MPDRKGGTSGTKKSHFFADGAYVAVTGWPNMEMTVAGGGWLGIAPAGQSITMRSLDFWRCEGGPESCVKPLTPAIDVEGQYKGRGNDNEYGQRLADIFTRMMNKELSVIQAEYDRAVVAEHPGAVTLYSWGDVETAWMGLRSSFPDAEFKIEHQIGREDPMLSPRGAIRWSLHGKRDGWGMFGQPTGADVYIMGFTHAEFGPYGLRRKFSLFDPISIWKQIHMQTG